VCPSGVPPAARGRLAAAARAARRAARPPRNHHRRAARTARNDAQRVRGDARDEALVARGAREQRGDDGLGARARRERAARAVGELRERHDGVPRHGGAQRARLAREKGRDEVQAREHARGRVGERAAHEQQLRKGRGRVLVARPRQRRAARRKERAVARGGRREGGAVGDRVRVDGGGCAGRGNLPTAAR